MVFEKIVLHIHFMLSLSLKELIFFPSRSHTQQHKSFSAAIREQNGLLVFWRIPDMHAMESSQKRCCQCWWIGVVVKCRDFWNIKHSVNALKYINNSHFPGPVSYTEVWVCCLLCQDNLISYTDRKDTDIWTTFHKLGINFEHAWISLQYVGFTIALRWLCTIL